MFRVSIAAAALIAVVSMSVGAAEATPVSASTVSVMSSRTMAPAAAVRQTLTLTVDFAVGSSALSDSSATSVRVWADAVLVALRGATVEQARLRLVIKGRAPSVRARGDIRPDRLLALMRATAVRSALGDLGEAAQVTVELTRGGGPASRTAEALATFDVQSGVSWRVRNGFRPGFGPAMTVIWTDAAGRSHTADVAPSAHVVARNLSVAPDGRSYVQVLISDPTNPAMEVRLRKFASSGVDPLCEMARTDGIPFGCLAAGSGTFLVVPFTFPPQ